MSEELFEPKIKNALKDRISKEENKTFTLLYKASQDECSLAKFQERCLEKGPTLTVLYGQDETVFGGYTSKSWISGVQRKPMYDREAFLFYRHPGKTTKFLEIEEKYHDRAITCHDEWGPTFGGGRYLSGYDLQVFRNRDNILKIGGFFKLSGNLNFNCIYKAKEEGFDGKSINREKLIVKDLEVYKVEAKDYINDSKEECKTRIKNSCSDTHVKCFNILMTGLVSAGKTSYCKTVMTASTGNIKKYAGPVAQQGESVTSEVYKFLVEPQDACKIQLLDIRGFEDERTYKEELGHLLKGKLIDGYKFSDNPKKPSVLVDDCNNTPDNTIHSLCVVIDATKFEVQSPKTLEHMAYIFKVAHQQGIHVCIIVTHVDKLCEYVHNCPDNIKRSVRVHNLTVKISDTLGINLDGIFPVINYTTEESSEEVKDILALRVLAKIVEHARAFVEQNIGPIKMAYIQKKLQTVKEKGLNILCVGRVNVGKSFFIDSLMSTFKKSKVCRAGGGLKRNNEMSLVPFTKKLLRYTIGITDEKKEFHETNVNIFDMPGFSSESNFEQICTIIEGHCSEEYEFKSQINAEMKEYIKHPEWSNRIHLVCFILDNESLDKPAEEKDMIHKVISKVLTPKDIPYLVVVTKLDKLRESGLTRDAVIKETAESFDLIADQIHAVKNYVDERQTLVEMDLPFIGCMEAIVDKGCFYYQQNHKTNLKQR